MEKKYAIGIDLGGTNLRIALVSRYGAIVQKIKEPTPAGLLEAILEKTGKFCCEDVAGIGFGVAGEIGLALLGGLAIAVAIRTADHAAFPARRWARRPGRGG